MVGLVGQGREAMGKIGRVGIPIPHSAEPARIQMKHLEAKVGGVGDHAPGDGLVYLHAGPPAVVDGEGVAGIRPGLGRTKHGAHPGPELVCRAIGAVAKCSQEYDWEFNAAARSEAGKNGSRFGVEPESGTKFLGCAAETDAGSPAKLDARVPACLAGAR